MSVLNGRTASFKLGVNNFRRSIWSNAVDQSAIARYMLLCFALLFAFVLPFICWGALAAPGHPHALPHLVFLDPPISSAYLHADALCNDVGAHHNDTDSHAPTGRATPDTSAVSLLLLVAMGDLFALPLLQLSYVENSPNPRGESVDHRVLTPPPRVHGYTKPDF